jgi:anthranilate phosphoribosyltransferase
MTDEKPKPNELAATIREALKGDTNITKPDLTPEQKAEIAAAGVSFKASTEAKSIESGFAAREAIRRAQSGSKGQSK